MALELKTLRKLISYDPETGDLTWLARDADVHPNDWGRRIFNAQRAGKPAFTSESHGYRQTTIMGGVFAAHRVAWAIYYGEWPRGEIDHINGVRNDNRIANLRDVTRQENCRNSALYGNNTSGHVGVTWDKNLKNWRSRIKIDGKTKHLGSFDSKDDAIAARVAADVEFCFHENHGRGAE